MKTLGTFQALGVTLTAVCGVYANGRLAIQLETFDGEPWAVLSVNLPDAPAPPKGHFYAKTWSENEVIRAAALRSGLFEDTGQRIPTGWVLAELWRLK